MALTMCDEGPVRRFAAMVGVGNVTGPHGSSNPRWKPRWTWSCNKRPDIQAVADMLSPWLSERRVQQVNQALAADTRDPSGARPPQSAQAKENISAALRGRRLTPEHRANLSEAKVGNTNGRGGKGRPKSPEHRANISRALKRHWATP